MSQTLGSHAQARQLPRSRPTTHHAWPRQEHGWPQPSHHGCSTRLHASQMDSSSRGVDPTRLEDLSSAMSRRQVHTMLMVATSSMFCPRQLANASTNTRTEQMRADYDRYAADYDSLDGGSAADTLGFDALREELLSKARGEVAEVAVGTGLNLRHYQWGPEGVSKVRALDLSQGMLDQARARKEANQQLAARDIVFQQADATSLPLDSSSMDTVLDTFSLCVISDPGAALREMARVVRPQVNGAGGGRVLLLEHTRSDNPLLAAYQDVTASAVAATAKGCVWNQDVPALLRQAGLTVARMERHVGGTILLIEAYKAG